MRGEVASTKTRCRRTCDGGIRMSKRSEMAMKLPQYSTAHTRSHHRLPTAQQCLFSPIPGHSLACKYIQSTVTRSLIVHIKSCFLIDRQTEASTDICLICFGSSMPACTGIYACSYQETLLGGRVFGALHHREPNDCHQCFRVSRVLRRRVMHTRYQDVHGSHRGGQSN